MLCYWGAQVREGFGLLQPDKVKHGNCGIRSMCPKSAVQDMSAGRSFIGFIRDGKVSVLRLRSEDCDGKLEQLQLKNDRIRSIVCGGEGAVLLADEGRVLIMDKYKSTVCRSLKGLENRQVAQIACGDQHSMALTNDGQLFVWGENSHGQLGLRKDHPGSVSAQRVENLCGIPLAQISAGGDHSFVLSLSGVVFGWGKNSSGQLGLGDTTDRHVPTVVNSLNRKKTVSISCGGEHTATLSKGGTVFTFGSGGSGQLGHSSFEDEHHPRVVAELWGSKVSQVTCGRRHTLVSVASSKLIYSFGCGMQGQLGNGEMIKQSVPFPVDLSNECDHEYTFEKLIAGENHSFALFFKEVESKPTSNCRGVLTLNDRMIDRWVSGSDSWATIKKEINTVFSSAASLNGSFLKTSCDEHYHTSEEHCGLDFDLVKTSFAKLLEDKRLISEVVKVVHYTLLPSLKPNPAGVEALRLYLLLPELIGGLQKQRTELTGAMASRILQLNPAARTMLEMYWSKLPSDWLRGLVKLFHKESAQLIGQISCGETGHDLTIHLQNFLQILQMLYKVCCTTHNDITNSGFIIHEVNALLDMSAGVNMLCYWGAQVREGFGLLQPDKVKHGNSGIRSMCPISVQDMSAGRSFLGFIQDGKASVLRLRSEDCEGKLEKIKLNNNRIRLISIVCGGDGAVLLADEGRVLIMDKYKSTVCRSLKGLENRQVAQITCGDQHSMALTKDGQLFVWGKNSHGQLGLRKDHPGSLSAQRVENLCGIPLAQISAGGDHSFVVSLSGVVFGWGKNSSGQLGLGDTTDRHVPTVVNSLNRKKTVSISCGGEHTATLSKGGTVFTFGSGGSGQLGHNSFKDEHLPRVVAELWGSKVSQVTCGRRHTLVSVASSKLIYSFGCGMQGQLGNGKIIKQSVPFPVDLSNECDHEYTFEKLIAGENHSFALFFKEVESKPKSNCRGVLTLNDRMIDRWVSGSDSWATIKKEINTVFSSAASLNGSFLKTSCDEHYQTSEEHCGLDFDLVKISFAKLLEDKRLISEVVKVVHYTLLPSLKPNPAGVEALRLYLLLPELIGGLQKQRTELTGAMASRILQLNPAARTMLEMYWSKLPSDWLRGLVKLFNKESAQLIGQISCGETGHYLTIHLQNFLQILQMLYKVCCTTHNDITNSGFIIHEVNALLDTLQVTVAELSEMRMSFCSDEDLKDLEKLREYYFEIIQILVKFPFAADTVSKRKMFRFSQMRCIESYTANELRINRESLLRDTVDRLENLRGKKRSFFHRLKVVFIGEKGIDMRGLSAEFFSLLSKSLLNWEKRVLKVHENSLVWFNPDHTKGNKDFYYLGIICGMALYNNHHISIDFPLALFKKLLQLSPSLNDLEELSPVEARSLKNLLKEDEDVVDILFLDFTVKGQELVPNGGQIQVTKVNRQKYVDLYVDFVFNKSVENQFKYFLEGFSEGCPLDIWTMFHPEELQELLHGSPKYDWQELLQSASYESCSASDELIKNFWTVFFEFSEENKKRFLRFLYGTDCVPAGGLSKRSLKICQSGGPDPDHCLPEAQTCFGRLILPQYSSINTLRNKLVHAISFCEVFGRE